MKAAGTNFFSSMRDFPAERFLIAAGVCLVLLLGSPNQIQAQTTYPVNGVAGFETGLQRIATVNNIVEPTIDWGDGTSSSSPNCLLTAITDSCALTVTTGLTTIDVYGTHKYAAAGQYTITITYGLLGKTVTTTATISPPGNFVILSIGDSIASGEGNPAVRESILHYPHWALWDDPYSDYSVSPFPADELAEWPKPSSHDMFPCHRSILAGPALAAQQIQSTNTGVTFVHYACSGAKINAGDTQRNWAQDASGQLRVARGRLPRIDVLLISAGANSINDGSDCVHKNTFGCGFGALFQYCVFHNCSTDTAFQADLNSSLSKLPGEYMTLAKEINCINQFGGLPDPSCTDPQKQIPKLVLITEYMDPTHDQNGNYPVLDTSVVPPRIDCPAFPTISQSQWQFFHDFVVHPLNHQFVDSFPSYAQQAGLSVPTYAVTGIEQDFLKHGLCAGSERWVLTLDDSTDALGSLHPQELLSGFSGAGHPNSSGHADYQGRIYAAIIKYNPPETTASATTDGSPYAFGTWTTHNVTVTLSAANAIKESGVGATLYAVDNANCLPSGPGVIPAGCLTYGGPFMITTSGKHTVTFFSQNGQGFPEATQNVQVWVDNEPPVMACTATPSVLWPPNNKMVPVALNVTAVSAAFGPTPFSLKSLTTSSGNAATDIAGFVIGQPSVAGFLRASRPGNAKAGESYTFVYQSSDPLGLTGSCTATVTVPHDQRKSNP